MSILEGLANIFNPVLSAIYSDAILLRQNVTKETTGATTTRERSELEIKLQPDRITKAMRDNAGDQYTEKDARFLVLQVDGDGKKIDPPIDITDRIDFEGRIWSLADITQDSAKVYWDMRATPIG